MSDKKKDPKQDEKAADAPKGRSKLPLIVVAAVVVLGGSAAGAYFMLKPEPPAATEEAEAKAPTGPAGLVGLEPFLVNISDPGAERYAKVQLKLAVVPEEAARELAANDLTLAQMRDRILTLLTAKSYEELATPLGKESFRREIKARLDPLLEDAEISEILFQDFVVQ